MTRKRMTSLLFLVGLIAGLFCQPQQLEFTREYDEACELPVARVVGGRSVTNIERFPYLVALQLFIPELGIYLHHCGGTLIGPRMVLTAAHCLWLSTSNVDYRYDEKFAEGPLEIPMFAAISPLCRHQPGLGRIPVVRYYMPRNYAGKPTTYDNYDIAILVLEEDAPEGAAFVDFEQAGVTDLDQVSIVTAIGYGGVSVGERRDQAVYASRVRPVQMGALTLYDPNRCEQEVKTVDSSYTINSDRVVCGFNENVDTCFGDSGGPLIIADGSQVLNINSGDPAKDIQIGIVSWGPDYGCTSIRGYPGIYTKMSIYVPWIKSIIDREGMGLGALAESSSSCPCSDAPPTSQAYASCQSLSDSCDAEFMQGFCLCTCGTCQPNEFDSNSYNSCGEPSAKGCDFEALLAFKNEVIGREAPMFANWQGEDTCQWQGITCKDVGGGNFRVSELSMSMNQNYSASITAQLSKLAYLEFIDLSHQNLVGPIPSELSTLKQLKQLHIHTNEITGSLPVEFSALENLEVFLGSYNRMRGPLPPEYANLKSMKIFHLGETRISGTIPPQYSALVGLTEFSMGKNRLKGVLPVEWSTCSNLKLFSAFGNQISGQLPPSWAELTALNYLSLSDNNLSGAVPLNWSKFGGQLQYLYLYKNPGLCGQKPSWIDAVEVADYQLGTSIGNSCF